MADSKDYILAELDVTDAAYFHDEYMPRVRPVLGRYDAKFLIATDEPEVLEGERAVKRVVFIEFASRAPAQAFHHSKDYQDVIDWFRSARSHLYLMEGVAPAP